VVVLVYDLLGYISIIFSLMSFLTENRQKFLIYGIISLVLIGISFVGYGGYTGAFVSFMSAISKMLCLKSDIFLQKKIRFSMPFIALAFFLFVGEGVHGLIPALSLIVIAFGDTFSEEGKSLVFTKKIYLVSATMWFGYALALMSPPAIAYDTLGIFVLLYSIKKTKTSFFSSDKVSPCIGECKKNFL